MTNIRSATSDTSIENGIKFLVKEITLHGHNPKPVILHSIRIAMKLYGYGYNEEIVLGALLHDLIEDGNSSVQTISRNFGVKIGQLVDALTLREDITDKKARYFDSVDRTLINGKSAIVIRAVDLLDNSFYYHLAPADLQPWLKEKLLFFMNKTKDVLVKEPLYDEIEKRCKVFTG